MIYLESATSYQLPDIFSMLYDLFIKSEGKKVQKIEQNNNGSINLVGDNNIIIINDYRPCCNTSAIIESPFLKGLPSKIVFWKPVS
jgi:hypothetical protein